MSWQDLTTWIGLGLGIPYVLMVLRWRLGHGKRCAEGDGAGPLHIVVACRDEADRVLPLLDALKDQPFASLVCVDDGSADGTREVIERWRSDIERSPSRHAGGTVRVIASEGAGKKAALRTGMRALPADADHVLLTDADARPGGDWVAGWSSVVAERPEVAMWIGEVRIGGGAGVRGAIERQEFGAMMAWAAATARRRRPANASGANLCVRRADWLAADLRAEVASGDDVFLAQHLGREAGKAVGWAADERTVVQVAPTPSWGALLQQRARWGRKSNRYPDRAATGTAVLVVAMNLWMGAGVAAGAWPVVAAKVLTDMALTRRTMGPHWRAGDALAFAVGYPVVVGAAVGLAFLFPGQIRWKRRPLHPST